MEQLRKGLAILCGNAILAFGIAAFIEPTGIICGGTTGVGLALQHWLGTPVSLVVSVINILFFIVGFYVLGKKFALSTALSTFAFPFLLSLFEKWPVLARLTDDMLLNAILAGGFFGLGIGIIIKTGASSGGLDIPPLVAKKWFEIPVSLGMIVVNCLVLLMQVPFTDIERILYGLVNTIIMSIVMDRILLSGSQQAQLLVISPKYEAIRDKLLLEDRGLTLVQIETGLLKVEQKAVLCVVPLRKLPVIKQLVQEVDEKSFIMINNITEVHGKGFSFARDYPRRLE